MRRLRITNQWPLVWPLFALGVSGCDAKKGADLYRDTGNSDGSSTTGTQAASGATVTSATVTSTTVTSGTGVTSGAATTSGTAGGTNSTTSASTTGNVDPVLALYGAPLIVAPTANSFRVSVVVQGGEPSVLRARLRLEGNSEWSEPMLPTTRAPDLAEWTFEGLEPGTRYEYDVSEVTDGEPKLHFEGSALTQRGSDESFSFAMLSDTHIGPYLDFYNQGDPEVLKAIAAEIGQATPDFVVNLGDMLDYHYFFFHAPPPSAEVAALAYQNYRAVLGDMAGHVGHFPVIGNWDGEAGSLTPEQIAMSRGQRQLYVPAPDPGTYPEGGGPGADYYAFTWGDALFIVLNVMSYTTAVHELNSDEAPDDWTLGADQLAWLEDTLKAATSKWRFTFIHHTVGGAAGDAANSAYGRGGGQAAYVGEQAIVHQMLLDYGVQIFFYGHDHVFADMVVDGVHYSMPGSAGAPWKFDSSLTGYTEYWDESGWGLVDVSPDSVHVQFIAMGGAVLHDYTLE